MKYKLTIAYDGTCYGGWQIQNNSTSIQTLIENALATVLRNPTPLTGAGRTDAGVHARAQIAHFTHDAEIDAYRTLASLNGLLPHDIRILKVESVPEDFHARYSALSKEYHYHLHLESVLDPFKRLYSYHFHQSLDLALLKEAASFFLGKRDFTSFANDSDEGSAGRNPVRTITRLDIVPERGGIRLEFEGDGFLYKMVRNITGTLIDVARGRTPLKTLPDIFMAKDRRRAGQAAPAQGLFLISVNY